MSKILLLLSLLALVLLIVLAVYSWGLRKEIQTSLDEGWFLPTWEVYSGPLTYKVGQIKNSSQIIREFKDMGLKERGMTQSLSDNEFSLLPDNICNQRLSGAAELKANTRSCLIAVLDQTNYIIQLSLNEILEIFKGDQLNPTLKIRLRPILIGQYLEGKSLRRNFKSLMDFPKSCLDATLAIEDRDFLKHKGISIKSIFRALIRNFKSGRISQGGSTLTQQLIKNKFLNSERSYKRKFKEALMALLLDYSISKDKILEAYLNIVYMGTDGVFELRGFPAAAEKYFDKPIEDLSIKECASLAASLKGPGTYRPGKAKNKERLALVLKAMNDEDWIGPNEYKQAQKSQLNLSTSPRPSYFFPYFVDAALQFAKTKTTKETKSLKIYTTLSIDHQTWAQKAIKKSLPQVSKKAGTSLEGLIVSSHPQTGEVLALINGTNIAKHSLNRVVKNKRQVGSLLKPFLVASSLKRGSSPLRMLPNTPKTYVFEQNTWSPKNYSKTSGGEVHLFQSLIHSMNLPMAFLVMDVGPKQWVSDMKNWGWDPGFLAVPSLALGATEALSPLKVLEMYSHLVLFHPGPKLYYVKEILAHDGRSLFKHEEAFNLLSPDPITEWAQTVALLTLTPKFGTARRVQSMDLKSQYGGKTGTSSGNKDAWFVGFDSENVTLAWTGAATPKSLSITGSSSALPLWMEYAKIKELHHPIAPSFEWPVDLEFKVYPGFYGSDPKLAKKLPESPFYLPFRSQDLENCGTELSPCSPLGVEKDI